MLPFEVLKTHAYRLFRPVLVLEDIFPREKRARVAMLVDLTLGALLLLVFFIFAVSSSDAAYVAGLRAFFVSIAYKAYGLLLIVFSVRFVLTSLEAFHRSYYFAGLARVLEAGRASHAGMPAPLSFEIAMIAHHSPGGDITRGFLEAPYGREVMLRSGIAPEQLEQFLSAKRTLLTSATFRLPGEGATTLPVYAAALFANDKALEQFLFEQGVSREDFVNAAAWVMRRTRRTRLLKRWWSRENLGRIPGIGKDWSYGETYLLERYGHTMEDDPAYQASTADIPKEDDPVLALESALAKARQTNALLIGSDETSVRSVIGHLAHLIGSSNVLGPLEHKRLWLVDLDAISATYSSKGAFETELSRLMHQAVSSGNTILVFEHLPALIRSAGALGTNLIDFLTPYLRSDAVQLIATADAASYNRELLPRDDIMQLFEVVRVKEEDSRASVLMLEDMAAHLEAHSGALITVPALEAMVEAAERYFPDGVMPDKAIDLLTEVVPATLARGKRFIEKRDVEDLVSAKTGVPLGEVDDDERERLLSLEKLLHERVVGQREAVSAISQALRRARAGVRNPERPIGSFLFLGPTGVGKTETAKALAEAFFGSEDALMRLDMSEFQGKDALEKLLGGMASEEAGRLATLLRERQYGVLLLDEFEKTESDVHDLFLGILDEGEFKDGSGKQVNARNILFIATSNAAADRIWELFNEGKDIVGERNALIDEIISRGLFRPELLNRFDDVVLFHPLAKEHIEKIAQLKLEGLKNRLKKRGVDLEITKDMVALVSEAGYDPKFGGRPMNRAIQEKVEQVVADKLLRGDIRRGAHVTLDAREFI